MPGASASLGWASGFLVHNLITDKLKSRSYWYKSFENLFVNPCISDFSFKNQDSNEATYKILYNSLTDQLYSNFQG